MKNLKILKAVIEDGIAREDILYGVGGLKETKARRQSRLDRRAGQLDIIDFIDSILEHPEKLEIFEKEFSEGELFKIN